jgi:hypothetical protein
MSILFRKSDDDFRWAITHDDEVICWYGAGNEDLRISDNCDKMKLSKSRIFNYELQGDPQLLKG